MLGPHGRQTGVAEHPVRVSRQNALHNRTATRAKRSAREGRLRAVHQMRQLSYTGPDQLRCRLKGLSTKDLVAEAAAMRPRVTGDPVAYATKTALASLGRRVQVLDEEASHLDETLAELVMTTAPKMLELFGVGFDTAAVLLVGGRRQSRAPALRGRLGPHVRG